MINGRLRLFILKTVICSYILEFVAEYFQFQSFYPFFLLCSMYHYILARKLSPLYVVKLKVFEIVFRLNKDELQEASEAPPWVKIHLRCFLLSNFC